MIMIYAQQNKAKQYCVHIFWDILWSTYTWMNYLSWNWTFTKTLLTPTAEVITVITLHCIRLIVLTHWGRVTHICVNNPTIIGLDNGLSPGGRQAIIWTNAGILLIGPLGTNYSEILVGIQTFSFKKLHLKTLSAKWRPFCLGLNVLTHSGLVMHAGISEMGHHWHR